jgi:CHAT domain-containing protein/Tfp pilus assembly protein PilF
LSLPRKASVPAAEKVTILRGKMTMKPCKLTWCLALPLLLVHLPVQAEETTSRGHDGSAKSETSCCPDPQVGQMADPEGLTLAKSLNDLGVEALKHDDLRKAEEYHRQALQIRLRLAPDSLDLADTFNGLGKIAENQGDLAKAMEYYEQALRIRRKLIPESLVVAENLHRLGNAAVNRGDLAKAEEYLVQSLDIRQKLAPGSRDLAFSLIGLGNLWWRRGDTPKEEEYFQRALQIAEKLSPLDSAAILDALGSACSQGSHPAKAKEYFEQALAIRQKMAPDSLGVAVSLSKLGNIAESGGDLARADNYLHQALEIRRKLAPASIAFAISLSNLAALAEVRGNLAQAEQDYRQALEIKQALVPESPVVADTLFTLGILFWMRENTPKAEEYLHHALEIRQRLAAGSPALAQSLNWAALVSERHGDLTQSEAYSRQALEIAEKLSPLNLITSQALANLGTLATRQGDLPQAEAYLRQAVAIQDQLVPDSPQEATTLQKLGNLARKRKDLAMAEKYFRQALAIRDAKMPGSAQQASVLFDLASVLRQEEQWDAAETLFSQATNILENQTSHLGGTEEDHSLFRAKYEARYKEYIDLLIAQKKPDLAFHVLERSRARSLLELLASAQINIKDGCDPKLLQQEHSLQESISSKSNDRIRLLNRGHTTKQLTVLDQQTAALREQYEEIEAQIQLKSPAYAALTQPQPLRLSDVQQQLLDGNTILLEYSLGEKRSFVWAVSETAVTVYELPAREIIEQKAREVYELLTGQSHSVDKESMPERRMRLAQREAEYTSASAELSQMVLGPVATLLEKKRLLIVSDGALQYVPYAALPVPTSPVSALRSTSPESSFATKNEAAMALVLDHEIVNLPSASVLAELRRVARNRKEPPKAVAVFADPVFDRRDERVVTSLAAKRREQQKVVASRLPANEPLVAQQRLTRSATDRGRNRDGQYLSRLLWTQREAAAIFNVTPAGQGMEALGFDANRATAMSPLLAQYRIVHFATHAFLDSKNPERSGLVLSLVDKRGQPQNGFLGLEQIYNLKLPADLVVLSACETGLGQEIRGEGLVGLARGFMYAGASRVMASLWSVEDEVTSELMARFYKSLEQDKLSPAAALRAAQIEVAKEKRWSSPYYWAGFQIQGEWK